MDKKVIPFEGFDAVLQHMLNTSTDEQASDLRFQSFDIGLTAASGRSKRTSLTNQAVQPQAQTQPPSQPSQYNTHHGPFENQQHNHPPAYNVNQYSSAEYPSSSEYPQHFQGYGEFYNNYNVYDNYSGDYTGQPYSSPSSPNSESYGNTYQMYGSGVSPYSTNRHSGQPNGPHQHQAGHGNSSTQQSTSGQNQTVSPYYSSVTTSQQVQPAAVPTPGQSSQNYFLSNANRQRASPDAARSAALLLQVAQKKANGDPAEQIMEIVNILAQCPASVLQQALESILLVTGEDGISEGYSKPSSGNNDQNNLARRQNRNNDLPLRTPPMDSNRLDDNKQKNKRVNNPRGRQPQQSAIGQMTNNGTVPTTDLNLSSRIQPPQAVPNVVGAASHPKMIQPHLPYGQSQLIQTSLYHNQPRTSQHNTVEGENSKDSNSRLRDGKVNGKSKGGHPLAKTDKYKTQTCMHFLQNRKCPYGDKCAFAHGEEEIRKH